MPEPTSSVVAVGLTAGGLTIFGLVTGLHPMLLLAGLAGGWWALSYQTTPMPLLRRVTALGISSLSAAWITPPAVAAIVSGGWLGTGATGHLLQFPVALIVGLLAHAAIGPALMKLTTRKIEEVA